MQSGDVLRCSPAIYSEAERLSGEEKDVGHVGKKWCSLLVGALSHSLNPSVKSFLTIKSHTLTSTDSDSDMTQRNKSAILFLSAPTLYLHCLIKW